MSVLATNSVTEIQARSMLQSDQVLSAADKLVNGTGGVTGGTVEAGEKRDNELRRRVDEFVGMTFYGTLLRTMRNSSMKGPYGHGGRGEEIFTGQLDTILAQRMGQASGSSLNEAVYRSLSSRAKAGQDQALSIGGRES